MALVSGKSLRTGFVVVGAVVPKEHGIVLIELVVDTNANLIGLGGSVAIEGKVRKDTGRDIEIRLRIILVQDGYRSRIELILRDHVAGIWVTDNLSGVRGVRYGGVRIVDLVGIFGTPQAVCPDRCGAQHRGKISATHGVRKCGRKVRLRLL